MKTDDLIKMAQRCQSREDLEELGRLLVRRGRAHVPDDLGTLEGERRETREQAERLGQAAASHLSRELPLREGWVWCGEACHPDGSVKVWVRADDGDDCPLFTEWHPPLPDHDLVEWVADELLRGFTPEPGEWEPWFTEEALDRIRSHASARNEKARQLGMSSTTQAYTQALIEMGWNPNEVERAASAANDTRLVRSIISGPHSITVGDTVALTNPSTGEEEVATVTDTPSPPRETPRPRRRQRPAWRSPYDFSRGRR